jgi:hypothetical protein
MAFKGWEKRWTKSADGSRVEAVCPVIVSASRATDIPAFFSDWLLNRLNAGFLKWINPFDSRQVQYVSFLKTRVVVFWTKNPKPLMERLSEIDSSGINYYFQFTLNDYEREDLEPNLPRLAERIDAFKSLSNIVGRKRVVWRYDPLMLTDRLTIEQLTERVAGIGDVLRDFTEKLVVSFADISIYKRVRKNLSRENIGYRDFTPDLMREFASRLQALNKPWGLKIASCAEGIDLKQYGIEHNRCVDDELMMELFKEDGDLMDFLGHKPGQSPDTPRGSLKDPGQRRDCGCIASKDIGMYDTCLHLCKYCYANASRESVEANVRRHKPDSDVLLSRI